MSSLRDRLRAVLEDPAISELDDALDALEDVVRADLPTAASSSQTGSSLRDQIAGPCVFCRIVDGSAPAKMVREWADAIAFVPLGPVTDGHVLVVPRQHVADAVEDPAVTAATMARAAEFAAEHEASNLITSIGRAATQSVFHLHIHVVPRVEGDALRLPWTALDQRDAEIARIKAALQERGEALARYQQATGQHQRVALDAKRRAEQAEAERDRLREAVRDWTTRLETQMKTGYDPGILSVSALTGMLSLAIPELRLAALDQTGNLYCPRCGDNTSFQKDELCPRCERELPDEVIDGLHQSLREQAEATEKAEDIIARSRAALASFDGRGVNNFDIPTAAEVLDAWRTSLDQPAKESQ